MFFRTESFQQFIRYYPIVTAIILIHILLFLAIEIPFSPFEWLFGLFAGVNFYISQGELWRLVTPIFIHSGFAHMLFNSFSLVLFGPALEQILGKTKFVLIYLAGGILANVATYLLQPPTYVHVGASGAIFGLFGYYVAIIVFRKHMLSRENSQIILTITVIGVIMTFMQSNINVTGHIFGLLAGFLIGSIAFSGDKGKRDQWGDYPPRRRASFHLGAIPPGRLTLYIIIILLVIIGFFSR